MRTMPQPFTIRMPARGGALAALLLAALLSGCLSPRKDPTRYYVLSGLPVTQTATQPGLKLGLARVVLPDYVNRRFLATRHGEEIRYSTFEEWAELPDRGVTRVLGANLAVLLGTDRVSVEPWSIKAVSRELHVSFEDFVLDEKGHGVLVSRWSVTAPGGVQVIQSGTSRVEKTSTAQPLNAAAHVRLLSDLLADFCRELAGRIGMSPL